MAQQLILFETQETTRADRIQRGLDAELRRQAIAILAEMARLAVDSPRPAEQEGPGDED